MLEMGVVVGLGLLVSLVKTSWSWKMRVLSNPLMVDMIVLAVLLVLHWGTFSGVMVATVGALFCSLVLSAARWFVGYLKDGKYVAGFKDVSDKLISV